MATVAPALASAEPGADTVDVPCVAGVLSCYEAPGPVPPPPPPRAVPCPGQDLLPTAATADAAEAATLCLVNRERRMHGLAALRPVASLTAAAGAYARRMATEDFFDHVSPGGSTFVTRIKRANYLDGSVRSWSAGENIAWGTGRLATPEAIIAAWMASAGHRRNILTPSFTELGLGISAGAPQRGVADSRAATYVNEFGQRRR